MDIHLSRRHFLGAAGAALLAPGLWATAAQGRKRPRVAAIYTVFRHRSHAHVILEKFLRPYLFRGRRIEPPVEVVSFYADQIAADGDVSAEVAKQFKIPLFKTIADALCLGGKELAVDAVLSIGEHGNYPTNKLGQVEYPRKRFFDEAVAVMRRSRRFVPFFNDKHLSYRWDWAREMYDTSRKLSIPLMAGSSVPLAERRPALELAAGGALEEAVSIHGGGVESYDFHGLEVLQSFVEARKGGETGVASVQFLRGDALWRAAKERRWSLPLAEAAMAAEFGKKVPDLRTLREGKLAEAHGILLTYRDGFRAIVLKLGRDSIRWNFAVKPVGAAARATRFYVGPWGNRNLFMALSHAIQDHFVQGRSPYPIERTLLTTGITEAAMRSRSQDGAQLQTPHLHIAYEARDFRAMREDGASWKVMPPGTPETKGITPIGDR
ncbi:MAG TPA: hypothetical protein VEL76_19320 [Gemmataceae bacterium]|nr:hypothetical protein [Gemmataceae bacterium]